MKKKYTVEIKPVAKRYLKKLSASLQMRITKRLEELELNPRPSGMVKLRDGKDIYRIRVGDYRIFYQIHDDVLLILVVKVGHRRDIYRQHE